MVNVDHFHVGWYQSADVGNFLSLSLLESQFHYQTSIDESVVVIYGVYILQGPNIDEIVIYVYLYEYGFAFDFRHCQDC